MSDEFIRTENVLYATYTSIHFTVPEKQIWMDISNCMWRREISSVNIAARHLLQLASSKITLYIHNKE